MQPAAGPAAAESGTRGGRTHRERDDPGTGCPGDCRCAAGPLPGRHLAMALLARPDIRRREPGGARTRRSGVKFPAVAFVGVLVPLLAVPACGSATSRDAESPVTAAASSAPVASHCAPGTGFALSLVSNRHGQRTPLAAAIWFAAHGTVPAIPHEGWRVTSRSDPGATVESGSVTLHAIQGPDKTWQVDGGERCT